MLGATLESLNRFIKSCVAESDAGQETCISSLPWMLPWPGAAFAAATRSADEARVRNRARHLGSETGGLDYLSRRSSGWIPRDTMSWRTVAQMAGRKEPALRPAADDIRIISLGSRGTPLLVIPDPWPTGLKISPGLLHPVCTERTVWTFAAAMQVVT